MRLLTFLLALWAPRLMACDVALVLAIDVSNSVDVAEYRLQTDGLADALRDTEVQEALVQASAAVAVLQWSGTGDQAVTQSWTRITSPEDARALSDRVRLDPRAFQLSDTAPAEAILASLALFDSAPDCTRRVIDISGDGTANAGRALPPVIAQAETSGVTINAIAIEAIGVAVSSYYRRHVTTRDGFVMTARFHRDYPRAIREKLIREVARQLM